MVAKRRGGQLLPFSSDLCNGPGWFCREPSGVRHGLAAFDHQSRFGSACVLFRPAVLVTYPIDTEVSEHLEAAGIVVVVLAP